MATTTIQVEEKIDLKALEYLPCSLLEQLTCPICQMILSEPYSTSCGHTFCKECIETFQQTNNSGPFKCPIDRYPLESKDDIGPAVYLVNSLINELEVKCPCMSRGCQFVGKKWVIENHIMKDCTYALVVCDGAIDNDDDLCTKLIEKRFVLDQQEKNEKLCLHQLITCPNGCGEKIEKFKVDDHTKNSCASITIECPSCEKNIPRPEYTNHSDVCLEMIMSCAGYKYGCQWNGKRLDYFHHHANECQLVLLEPTLSIQDQRMTVLERENTNLRSQIERLISLTNRSATNIDQADSANSSSFNDSDLLHMFMECERLRVDVDRLATTLRELEAKQSMMIIRENCRTGEEIAALRAGFNGLRQQMHFLLTERRSIVSRQLETNNVPTRRLSGKYKTKKN